MKLVERDWVSYRNSNGEILDCHILDFGRPTAIDDIDVIAIGTADLQYLFYTPEERSVRDGVQYVENDGQWQM